MTYGPNYYTSRWSDFENYIVRKAHWGFFKQILHFKFDQTEPSYKKKEFERWVIRSLVNDRTMSVKKKLWSNQLEKSNWVTSYSNCFIVYRPELIHTAISNKSKNLLLFTWLILLHLYYFINLFTRFLLKKFRYDWRHKANVFVPFLFLFLIRWKTILSFIWDTVPHLNKPRGNDPASGEPAFRLEPCGILGSLVLARL